MKKRRIEITQHNITSEATRLVWNRIGFDGGMDTIKEDVRDLSLDEKVTLLTDVFINEMALAHMNKKRDFLLNIGHKTWVDGDELYEIAKATYTDMDDVEWKIDHHHFYSIEIDRRNGEITQMNSTGLKVREAQRKGTAK